MRLRISDQQRMILNALSEVQPKSLDYYDLLNWFKQERGLAEITNSLSSSYSRSIHKLFRRGFLRVENTTFGVGHIRSRSWHWINLSITKEGLAYLAEQLN